MGSNFKQFIKGLINKPLFWVILFFCLRLIGITNPPLEVSHNWRQTTGLMVARNFVEVDNSIIYPRVDNTEAKSGIIGMEFPFLNYLHYLISLLFGYEHWYGRILNLLVTSTGIFFFSRLVEKWTNKKTALFSSIVLLVSIWFAFSRKMMPDTFSISLSFIGIFYLYEFIEKGKHLKLFIGFILFTLGILSKIPAIIYLSFLIPGIINNKDKKERILYLLCSLILSFVALVYWYFLWNPYLSIEFGNWYNSGMSFKEGIFELYHNLPAVAKNFYFNSFQSYLLFPLAFLGIFKLIKDNKLRILIASSLFLFGLFMCKAGFFFHHHNYYIIPIVPIFAMGVGYFLSNIKNQKIAVVFLLIGATEALANQAHDFRIKDSNLYKIELESIMNQVSNRDELVAINIPDNPQQLYLSHRKGWLVESEKFSNKAYLEEIKSKGCKYIIIDQNEEDISLNLPKVYDDENYIIYKLSSK